MAWYGISRCEANYYFKMRPKPSLPAWSPVILRGRRHGLQSVGEVGTNP